MIFKREKEIVANIATAVTGYRVTPELLESRTRKKEVVNTRQVLMYIMWQNKITLSTIGAAFRKDHATVIHARKTVMRDLEMGYNPTTSIYEKSKARVDESILTGTEEETKRFLTLAEQLEVTKKRAKFREQQAVKDAERVVSYALEMMERGNAQGWARHRLKLKVAEVFPEMGVRL
jgi:uncharacterized membrane protein YheB (UPF0754 family)